MTIGVLVDIDVGMERTGVATAAAALELARHVSDHLGLTVRRTDGIRGPYPVHRRPGREARSDR